MAGIEYQNILQHLERISDQCSDLGVYMLGRTDANVYGNEHQYLHNLHHSNNQEYLSEFNNYYARYFDRLKQIGPAIPAGSMPAVADSSSAPGIPAVGTE